MLSYTFINSHSQMSDPLLFLSNISFLGTQKETSHGEVSFTHPKHIMLLLTVIKIKLG